MFAVDHGSRTWMKADIISKIFRPFSDVLLYQTIDIHTSVAEQSQNISGSVVPQMRDVPPPIDQLALDPRELFARGFSRESGELLKPGVTEDRSDSGDDPDFVAGSEFMGRPQAREIFPELFDLPGLSRKPFLSSVLGQSAIVIEDAEVEYVIHFGQNEQTFARCGDATHIVKRGDQSQVARLEYAHQAELQDSIGYWCLSAAPSGCADIVNRPARRAAFPSAVQAWLMGLAPFFLGWLRMSALGRSSLRALYREQAGEIQHRSLFSTQDGEWNWEWNWDVWVAARFLVHMKAESL
jgi:hypothetical protein